MGNSSKKNDQAPLIMRLAQYQKERFPVIGIILIAATLSGVIYRFSSADISSYLRVVAIIVLYLAQIRASDEKKDFEHDNLYHKDRPVQRGLVSLDELAKVNTLAIVTQLALYASFMNRNVLLLALLSQFYAFLTRKEFFVRTWIRQHFHIYNFSHYIQLVILYYAMVVILEPDPAGYALLTAYSATHVTILELGRKMYSVKEDTTDDSYSAQLGYKGSSVAMMISAGSSTVFSMYILNRFGDSPQYIIAPALVCLLVFVISFRYGKDPNQQNADRVEGLAVLMFLTSLASLIVGL